MVGGCGRRMEGKRKKVGISSLSKKALIQAGAQQKDASDNFTLMVLDSGRCFACFARPIFGERTSELCLLANQNPKNLLSESNDKPMIHKCNFKFRILTHSDVTVAVNIA